MLDSGTLTLLKMGFGLAGDVLRLLNRRTPVQAAQVAPPAESGIGSLIDSSAARIQAAIADSATQIVDKIESDKLEELQSRVKNLAFLVKMGKTDQALHYAMTLRESVDYARNRLRENKMRWLGSWLAGQSVFLASLEYCGSCTEEVITEFQEEVQSARIELLDLLAPTLLSMDKGKPWLAIAAFAQGEDTQLFEKIPPFGGAAPEASKAPRTPRTVKARPRQSATDKTTALSADDILTVLKVYAGTRDFFLHPDIPPKKLTNAMSECKVSPDDTVLALIDCTVFGSAKDCILFARRGLYHHNSLGPMSEPIFVSYEEFPTIRFAESLVHKGMIDLGNDRICAPSGMGIPLPGLIQVLDALKKASQ